MTLTKTLAAMVLIFSCSISGAARAQSGPDIKIPPGVYSIIYTCKDGASVPANIYVLDQYEKFFSGNYVNQKVRVEVKDAVFVGMVLLNGMKQVRITDDEFEVMPSGGRQSVLTTFDIDSFANGLRGSTKFERDECRFAPRNNPNAKTLAAMSYPTRKAVLPPPYANTPTPQGFVATNLPASTAATIRTKLAAAMRADSESWAINRLKGGSISDFAFFASPAEPGVVLVRASYLYDDFYGSDNRGWGEARIVGGGVECIRFFDKRTCTRPRPGKAEQVASLANGKPKLGPIDVAPRCFVAERRVSPATPVYETVQTGPGPGDFERRLVRVSPGQPYTVDVYKCARRDFEIACVAQGTDAVTEWLLGTGSTRNKSLSLIPNGAQVSRQDIAAINRRIGAGSCARIS